MPVLPQEGQRYQFDVYFGRYFSYFLSHLLNATKGHVVKMSHVKRKLIFIISDQLL